jgi:hypothetical protein
VRTVVIAVLAWLLLHPPAPAVVVIAPPPPLQPLIVGRPTPILDARDRPRCACWFMDRECTPRLDPPECLR